MNNNKLFSLSSIFVLCFLFLQTQLYAQTPEINLKIDTTSTASNGSYNFGSSNVGTATAAITFTIQNLGGGTLSLPGTPIVGITGPNASDFTIAQTSTASFVSPSGTTTFTVAFNPSGTGTRTAGIFIVNNDSDEPNYQINVTGTGIGPDINLRAGTNIPSGASYNLGSSPVGTATAATTFTIENLGAVTLTLPGTPIVNLLGGTDFLINQSATSPSIVAGGSTNFTITFKPLASGTRGDTIIIMNNDSDESPYFITLTGTGTAASGPDINIKSVGATGGTSIVSGGSYTFSSTDVGTSTTATTFIIENTGTSNLTFLSNPIIAISDTFDFSINQTGISNILGPGGSTTFSVSFKPYAAGGRQSDITVKSDDPDEGTYLISLFGTGTVPSSGPEINIKPSGGSSISSGGSYNFGSSDIGTSTPSTTFVIENTGTAGGGTTGNLTLSGNPLVAISGANAAEFIVDIVSLTPSIGPGGSTNFTIRFNPSGSGTRTATITIVNDDSNEGSYVINLTGTGATPVGMYIVGSEFVLPKTVETYKVSVPASWTYTYTWTYSGSNYFFFPGSSGPEVGLFFTDTATSGKLRCTAYSGSGVFTFEEIDITVNTNPTNAFQLAELQCPDAVTDCSAGYIHNFSISSISNLTSGCNKNGYTDYTRSNITDTLNLGGVYSAKLTMFNPNTSVINYVGIWVDYDNDGDFSNSDEFIAQASGNITEISLTNIKFENKEGYDGPKRLRVQTRPNVPFTAGESCALTGGLGETEDYLIVLSTQDALEAPQIITPNEDGKNDYFVIRGIDPSTENKLTVFDRLGAVKYSSSNYENNWNGIASSGDKLSPGTYYFVFTNDSNSIKGFLEIRY
jgi:gliding motility-associated-like protein